MSDKIILGCYDDEGEYKNCRDCQYNDNLTSCHDWLESKGTGIEIANLYDQHRSITIDTK